MRELQLAGIPSIDAPPSRRDGATRFPLSRAALIASAVAHVLAGFALTRHKWADAPPPTDTIAAFFVFERPAPRAEPIPETPPVEPPPQVEQLELEPPPRVAEPAPQIEPAPAVVLELPVVEEGVPPPLPFIDFSEERLRAAREVVTERGADEEYLTFSLDDVAPPRPEAAPERRSIFDGTGEPRGPKVGQLGQARTKLGHRLAGLCNALTGGFSLMGFGSFCAPPPDGSPSGLFPEVRPAYLDLMPECVDTRDTAPALALEAPFPTVKCRLVKQEDFDDQP